MSTTPPATSAATPARKPPSAAAKYLFVFAIGLVLGMIAIVMLLRSLESRKTWQDHYPHAVMQLFSAQTAQLRANAEANRCNPTDTLPFLQSLRSLGNDLEPAFPDLREDQRFATHASHFRATLDAALASPPLGCESLAQANKQIGEACKACHQDFR